MTAIKNILTCTAVLYLGILPEATFGQNVGFDRSWSEQRFSMLSSNEYGRSGNSLSIASDGTVSMIYRQLDTSLWSAQSASWEWSVQTSVPPTDLTQKGGDDRNISLYFVFMDQAEAEALKENASIRSLLTAKTARVLMYVHGGNHQRGELLPSPYLGAQGRTKVMRPAGTGSYAEKVDLLSDFRRAFGEEPKALVGLAVSADSDDTETMIDASVSNLRIF